MGGPLVPDKEDITRFNELGKLTKLVMDITKIRHLKNSQYTKREIAEGVLEEIGAGKNKEVRNFILSSYD